MISPDEDPAKLLEEIAQCADAYEPIPPSLSNWFISMWEQGRVTVSPPFSVGAREREDLTRQAAALALFDEEIKKGCPVGEARKKVIHQLRLRIGDSTFKAWRVERDHDQAMDHIEQHEPARQALVRAKASALLAFAELERSGVSEDEALRLVHCRPMQEVVPTLETLGHWQRSESAYAR
jgi:hypothetical protein